MIKGMRSVSLFFLEMQKSSHLWNMSVNPLIDFRSDTVTKPTRRMQEAMWSAPVGDDVFGEDPSVKLLEEKAAKLFGMEASLFVASGTMANQIAIRLLTQAQEEIICDKTAHFYYYESGGTASNSGVSMRFIDGDRGRITADQVQENINDRNNFHLPYSSLVALENTSNKGGGSCYQLSEVRKISTLCRRNKLKLHLDGARIFNALTVTKDAPEEYGKLTDTLSFCLSKGLGAPVGSMLLSSAENILKAKRIRKAFGGAMRQIGYFAAAGVYALDHHVQRLVEDHEKARTISKLLSGQAFVSEVLPVETNIIVFRLAEKSLVHDLLAHLQTSGILAFAFGPDMIRFVTHLDIPEHYAETLEKSLKKF